MKPVDLVFAVVSFLPMSCALAQDPTPPAAGMQDNRQAVSLSVDERTWLLHEMRDNLTAIQAIAAALEHGDVALVHQIADTKTTAAWNADTTRPPTIRAKLPDAWKAMAVAIHREYDGIAEGAAGQENTPQLIGRVGRMMQNCVACHTIYRLDPPPQ